MGIEIDETRFPNINIKFNNDPLDDESFNNFLSVWIKYYNLKKDFNFVIDTRDLKHIPNLKYSLALCLFLKKLKRDNNYHYLKNSYIFINDSRIRNLLDFIFHIQKPVSKIYYRY